MKKQPHTVVRDCCTHQYLIVNGKLEVYNLLSVYKPICAKNTPIAYPNL